MLESEIDKTIPYLDKLNNEIKILKNHNINKENLILISNNLQKKETPLGCFNIN